MDQIDRVPGITGSEDKNPDLNNLCDDMRKAGMKVTDQFKSIWMSGIQYTWGNHLRSMKEVKKNWEYVVVNRIRPLLMQNISKLAKNNPKIMTHAWNQEQEGVDKFVEAWAGHLQYLWQSPYKLNMRAEIIKGLLDAGVFGYMVGKTIWDDKVRWLPEEKAWHEDVEHTFVHPVFFWMDPAAENMKTARNCGTFRPRVELEWAQARWPKFAKEIEKEAYTSQDARYSEGDQILYESQKGSTLETNKNIFNRMAGIVLKYGFGKHEVDEQVGNQRYVTIDEIYWKDDKRTHRKIEDVIKAERLVQMGMVRIEPGTGVVYDAKTNEPISKADWPKEIIKEYDEPNFPNGRFILRIGRTILNPDEKDQKYTESRWPFEVMPYHILPHMWQGENAVESGRANNDILNISISSMVNHMMRTADPTKLVEAGALAKDRKGKVKSTRDDITGIGRIVIAAKGKVRAIMNMVYPPLDPVVLQVAELMKKDLDDQLFMPPVARGQSEKRGKISATEAAKLDINAHDYTAMQAIFLDIFIDNTATLIAELCQRHYEPGRMMRVLNKDGQGFREVDQTALDVRFDVNIEPGSTLPFDEEKKQNEVLKAYELCAAPVANPMLEEALRILNISNRQEILARHKGYLLFHKFIQLGQMVAQVPPEDLQAVVQKMPYLQPVIEILMQVGQLAPQTGMAQQQEKKKGAA